MIVEAKKSFNKDIGKITDSNLAERVKETISSIEEARMISEIQHTIKMKGSVNAFRIKIGDYRLGFFLKNNVVELTAFAHRKDIYKYFP